MKRLIQRMWRDDAGTLSFEWVTLTTLLTIGAVGGLATVRDAIVDEMADLTEAIVSLDQSYVVQPPLTVQVHDGSGFNSRAKVREFRSTGPGVGVQVRPRGFSSSRGGVSGAAGSIFQDSRPEVDREALDQPMGQPEPNPLEGDL